MYQHFYVERTEIAISRDNHTLLLSKPFEFKIHEFMKILSVLWNSRREVMWYYLHLTVVGQELRY